MNREINIENTIYINNLLATNQVYSYDFCGVVDEEYVDRFIIDQYSATVEYDVPYEDWTDSWSVPKKYFTMSDEEILADAKAEYLAEEARQEAQELAQLHRDAKRLGYSLVKLEGEYNV